MLGVQAPCEVKCNYICNEVALVCPTGVCGGYQRRSNFKRRNQQRDWWTPGISGKASHDRDCRYKKGAAGEKRENERQSQRERKRANGRCTEEGSETTWQQDIARRTVQPTPGVCTCRWTVQESLTSNEDTDEPDAVSTWSMD